MTVRAGQLSVTMRTATAPRASGRAAGPAPGRRDRWTRPLLVTAQREPAAAPAPSAASVAALAAAPPNALSAAA